MFQKCRAYLLRRGLLTDAVATPENSRAATTYQQGGNQALSDVYSDCLTPVLQGLTESGRVCKRAGGLTATVESKNPIL